MAGYGSTAVMQSYGGSYGGFTQPSFAPQAPTTPDSGRKTRSGRTISRAQSPSRITKSTSRANNNRSPARNRNTSTSRPARDRSPVRSRSRAPAPRAKPSTSTLNTPQISMPLSILTANMTVPVKDIAAWVNRPASVRQAEAETRNGYVTRPMNSFMLYRSAYAERTKQWGLQNNHQVVSKLAGQSWPLEPEIIKRQYEEYARIERDNHTAAHPGYKFSPSKIGPVTRKREKEAALREDVSDSNSDDSDDSDVESDAEFRPTRGAGRNGRGRNPSRRGRGNRDAPSAPMTPPNRTAAFQSYHDASPNPVPGYGAPLAWMGADGNMYTASPDSRGHGQQAQDYSSYNFDNYQQQQQPLQYEQYQPAHQQQHYQLQPTTSSYGYGADLSQSHDQQYLHQQLAAQQTHQQQPYYDQNAAMPVGLPGMTQSQIQDHGVGLDMYGSGVQQQQSMYPELEQVPRHHHGLDGGASLGHSQQQHHIDPALFQLEMDGQQQQHGQSVHSMGHVEEHQPPAWDEAFGTGTSSWNNY